jgi:hypothetical protein
MTRSRFALFSITAALGTMISSGLWLAACGGNDNGGTSSGGTPVTGQACSVPAQCYPSIADASTLRGTVTCLTKVTNGYCTHTCNVDSDCCAVPGECGNHPEVCAPFESTGVSYCFLSCEAALLGGLDSTLYCQDYANAAFGCRSTGGGKDNRQVCLP